MSGLLPDVGDAEFLGFSLKGRLYRSRDRRTMIRVVRLQSYPAQKRNGEVQCLVHMPETRGWAKVIDAAQKGDGVFYYVTYAVAPNARSLVEILREDRFEKRIAAIEAVVRAYPFWRDAWYQSPLLNNPIWPTPYDFTIEADGRATLLAMPFGDWPNFQTASDDPSNVYYLRPAYVRGLNPPNYLSIDSYSLMVCVLQAITTFPKSRSAASSLAACAKGGIASSKGWDFRLPFWMGFGNVVIVERLMASILTVLQDQGEPKNSYWAVLAGLLADLRRATPEAEARALVQSGRPGEALSLLQNAKIESSDAGMLLLGAEIALNTLSLPLVAIDFCNTLLGNEPHNIEALYLRLLSITDPSCDPALSARPPDALVEEAMESIVIRDAPRLAKVRGEEVYSRVATFLSRRARYREVISLLEEVVRNRHGLIYWKPQLLVPYVEACIRCGDSTKGLETCREFQERLQKPGVLSMAMNQSAISESEFRAASQALKQLEVQLTETATSGGAS